MEDSYQEPSRNMRAYSLKVHCQNLCLNQDRNLEGGRERLREGLSLTMSAPKPPRKNSRVTAEPMVKQSRPLTSFPL